MPTTLLSSSRAEATHACATVMHAFSSWDSFKAAIQVQNTLADGQTNYVNADPVWMNEDLEPTPPHKRTWGFYTYCLFYFGVSFGNWNLGATMIGIGLSWWQAILVIFVAQVISAIAQAFNTRPSATYHLGFPAICRVVFGMYGSFFFVGVRALLALVWYGVQLYSGASHVGNMLRAIFGDAYNNIPNHLPESAGITTKKMLAFVIFWLIHFVFCFFRPYQLTRFFWFKGFIMLPAVFGVFIYCMIVSGGKVGSTLAQTNVTGGIGWAIMHGINSGMGNTATLITNQPDIARWSKTRSAAITSQLMVQPLAVATAASLGILATAAINGKWGLQLWNPWDLLDAIQDRHDSPAARFAIFLAAFVWTVSILGTNIAANMISFGADVSLLWPRYIDMKRGFFLVEFLAFAIVPWKIMASAAAFTQFLSGYGLFMASVVAIMIADYYLLTKGNIMTAWVFDPTKSNVHYRYHKGWNLQALAAYICGLALPFPGFVSSLGARGVNQAGKSLFYIAWLLSFCVSFVSYVAICRFWPTRNQKLIREDGLGWEESACKTLEAEDGAAEEIGVQQVRVDDLVTEKQATV